MSDHSMQLKLTTTQNKTAYFHAYWLTSDGIRYTFLVDRLLMIGKNVLLMGPSGVGKTRLLRNYAGKILK